MICSGSHILTLRRKKGKSHLDIFLIPVFGAGPLGLCQTSGPFLLPTHPLLPADAVSWALSWQEQIRGGGPIGHPQRARGQAAKEGALGAVLCEEVRALREQTMNNHRPPGRVTMWSVKEIQLLGSGFSLGKTATHISIRQVSPIKFNSGKAKFKEELIFLPAVGQALPH